MKRSKKEKVGRVAKKIRMLQSEINKLKSITDIDSGSGDDGDGKSSDEDYYVSSDGKNT